MSIMYRIVWRSRVNPQECGNGRWEHETFGLRLAKQVGELNKTAKPGVHYWLQEKDGDA
jgi:hypothetical protein